ncbi:MAG: hypothetical protein ACRD0J_07125 [Acidimicrobiales bacterium]
MRHRLAVLAIGTAAFSLAGTGPAFAAGAHGNGHGIGRHGPGYPVVPGTYNPGHVGGIEAAWVTHVGEPDAGHSDHALVLGKKSPTATNASAYAVLERVSGTVWNDQLGFDYKTGSYCGAGSPRFDVVDSSGVDHFFGCIYGTQKNLGNGWTQDRFTGSDAFPPIPKGTPIRSITLVQDEHGRAVLDNIFYNGRTMGKPGA